MSLVRLVRARWWALRARQAARCVASVVKRDAEGTQSRRRLVGRVHVPMLAEILDMLRFPGRGIVKEYMISMR